METMSVCALADDCTNHIITDMTVAKKLQLRGKLKWYRISGAGGHSSRHRALKSKLTLLDQNGEPLATITVYCLKNPVGFAKMHDWPELQKAWKHLKDIPLPDMPQDNTIRIIVGAKVQKLISSIQRDTWGEGLSDPVGKKTMLGWFIAGRTEPKDYHQGKFKRFREIFVK